MRACVRACMRACVCVCVCVCVCAAGAGRPAGRRLVAGLLRAGHGGPPHAPRQTVKFVRVIRYIRVIRSSSHPSADGPPRSRLRTALRTHRRPRARFSTLLLSHSPAIPPARAREVQPERPASVNAAAAVHSAGCVVAWPSQGRPRSCGGLRALLRTGASSAASESSAVSESYTAAHGHGGQPAPLRKLFRETGKTANIFCRTFPCSWNP